MIDAKLHNCGDLLFIRYLASNFNWIVRTLIKNRTRIFSLKTCFCLTKKFNRSMTTIRIKQPCDYPSEIIVGDNELIAVDVNVATGILPASTGTLDMMQRQAPTDIGELTGVAVLYITKTKNISSDEPIEQMTLREGDATLSDSLRNVENINGLQVACNANYIAIKSSGDVIRGNHHYHFIFQYEIDNNYWNPPYNGLLTINVR